MNFRFFWRGSSLIVDVLKVNWFTQFIGLMFSSRETKIRLFSYSKDSKIMIHSWFVFYPFIIIWLDKEKKVISWKKVLPFTFSVVPQKKFRHFIEVPFNSTNKKILKRFLSKEELSKI